MAAAVDVVPAETLRLPLWYQQERVGELLIAPRASGEALDAADRHQGCPALDWDSFPGSVGTSNR